MIELIFIAVALVAAVVIGSVIREERAKYPRLRK